MLNKRALLVSVTTFVIILLGLDFARAGLMYEQRTIFTIQMMPATKQQYDMLKEQMKSVPPAARAQMEKALKQLESSFKPETTYQTVYFGDGMMKSVDKETGEITIIRMDKDVIWHINLKDSTYMEMKLSEIKKMLGKAKKALKEMGEEMPTIAEEEPTKKIESKYEVKATGEKKEIAGYNCQKFIVITTSEQTEVWITKDIDITRYLASFKDFYKDLGLEEAISKAMLKIKGFPMATKSKNMIQEVLKVSEQKLSEKVFSLPKGLKLKRMEILEEIEQK